MQEILEALQRACEAIRQKLSEALRSLRTNRPTTALVEDILVEYYESAMPLKQLASLAIVPPREIQVSAWDKGVVGPIAKAIEGSGRGLTASPEGNMVHVHIPSLTDERRAELTRMVKKMVEESRIAIRALRDDANKTIARGEKEKRIDEDERFQLQKKIQEIVDTTNAAIEGSLAAKVREIEE